MLNKSKRLQRIAKIEEEKTEKAELNNQIFQQKKEVEDLKNELLQAEENCHDVEKNRDLLANFWWKVIDDQGKPI